MIWIASLIASFVMKFLKGFQYQNVIGGHYQSAVIISCAVSVGEVLVIALVAVNGLQTIVPVCIGGAIGIVTSMYVHRKYMGKGKGT